MARPQIPAGELGTTHITQLPSGRYRARASTRDDAGLMYRLAATATTEEGARAELRRQAMTLSTGGAVGRNLVSGSGQLGRQFFARSG